MYSHMLCLCLLGGSATHGPLHEPKPITCEHAVEHTVTGMRATLRRGYPNDLSPYARTIRISLTRDQFGRVLKATLERDEQYSITASTGRTTTFHGPHVSYAIDSFCREAYLPDQDIDFEGCKITRRMHLSEFLNERLLPDKFFLKSRKHFTFCRDVHELVVEPVRR